MRNHLTEALGKRLEQLVNLQQVRVHYRDVYPSHARPAFSPSFRFF